MLGDDFISRISIPVGISDFAEIRKNNYYYVDKSGLIRELLKTSSTKVKLITRPRRFGKTLAMSMLASFFDIRLDSRSFFQGLEIASDSALCQEWMNQYPVVFLTFKNVDGLQFETAYGQLSYEVSRLYEQYTYLLESDCCSQNEKEIFTRIQTQNCTSIELSRSLQLLLQLLNRYYHKTVILLLDEYDVPLSKASTYNYYDQMLEIIRGMMTTALKDNSSLRFAIVTGCLKISKESIFTGTNNFVSDTIRRSHLNEFFGFTQKDILHILKDADAESHAAEIQDWYDGYRFSDIEVYCPWDVMNYLLDLQNDPNARPVSYWKNTSDNAIIRSFIDSAGSSITGKLELLMDGGYIIQQIDEDLTYNYLHSSEDNLWSILYLTGYLTQEKTEKISSLLPEGSTALRIPNREILEIFKSTVITWFQDSAVRWNRNALFDAVWSGNCDIITQEMSRLLRRTISYHDYHKGYYHAFLTGIFAGAGYMTESNKEHGEGRSDVVVYDFEGGKAAVFEAKYVHAPEEMEAACEKAIQQIDSRGYARELSDNYSEVFCYGISFYRKRCLVKIKD